MKDNARKSAELIIAEAEVKAEKILNNAHNRLAQLHEDISELKRQRTQIEVQIGSIVEAHSKLLELSKEGAKTMDEQDAKLKVLTALEPLPFRGSRFRGFEVKIATGTPKSD